MGELVFAFLQATADLIGYYTARAVVPVISFGRARVDSSDEDCAYNQKWNEFRRDSDGKFVINAIAGMLFGWLFLIVFVVTWVFIYDHLNGPGHR